MSADFITILPSALIAEVMEQYFNQEMYKRTVKVVELKMQDDMCRFELEWVTEEVTSILPSKEDISRYDVYAPGLGVQPVLVDSNVAAKVNRNSNGKFAKKGT